jgi:hypothetical protein
MYYQFSLSPNILLTQVTLEFTKKGNQKVNQKGNQKPSIKEGQTMQLTK